MHIIGVFWLGARVFLLVGVVWVVVRVLLGYSWGDLGGCYVLLLWSFCCGEEGIPGTSLWQGSSLTASVEEDVPLCDWILGE